MAVRQIRDSRAVARRRNARLVLVRPAGPAPTVREPKPPPPPKANTSRSVVVALGVLLVAALVALGLAGRQWYEQSRRGAAQRAAVAAATQATVNFVSISASTVDRDLQRIAGAATGDFSDEFNRGRQQVRTAVLENGVESRGTVLRAGLVSGDPDSAVVLVAVDATVRNKAAPNGKLSHYRIQVDMALDPESGRWLVSRLQFVG